MAEQHTSMIDPNQSVINHIMADDQSLDHQSPTVSLEGILKISSGKAPSGGASNSVIGFSETNIDWKQSSATN
jgi:hypothetical protein